MYCSLYVWSFLCSFINVKKVFYQIFRQGNIWKRLLTDNTFVIAVVAKVVFHPVLFFFSLQRSSSIRPYFCFCKSCLPSGYVVLLQKNTSSIRLNFCFAKVVFNPAVLLMLKSPSIRPCFCCKCRLLLMKKSSLIRPHLVINIEAGDGEGHVDGHLGHL